MSTRKPEVLLTRGRVRLVAVPYEESETGEQDRDAFDIWKDRANQRRIEVEISDGNDLMGHPRWRELSWWSSEDVPRSKVKDIVAELINMLGDTGILGETKEDRDS